MLTAPGQRPVEISNVYLSMVPDGVARVVWTFPRLKVPPVRLSHGPVFPGRVIPAAKLTASVQGNVAAAEKPRYQTAFASATTWYAADGYVIKTFRYPVTRFPSHIPSSGTITETEKMVGTPVPPGC
jgi:hypothetical protein